MSGGEIMIIKNRNINIIYKLVIVFCALFGILTQCGAFYGFSKPDKLYYYTNISNFACAVYFFFAAVSLIKGKSGFAAQARGAVIMAITVTGLIYHFMLSQYFYLQDTTVLSNTLVHYVVPALSFFDWILFEEKGSYKKHSPFLWVLFPNGYFVFVLVCVALGASMGIDSRFPYPFIDIDLLGAGRVALNVVVLNILFILLGFIFVLADACMHRLCEKRKR